MKKTIRMFIAMILTMTLLFSCFSLVIAETANSAVPDEEEVQTESTENIEKIEDDLSQTTITEPVVVTVADSPFNAEDVIVEREGNDLTAVEVYSEGDQPAEATFNGDIESTLTENPENHFQVHNTALEITNNDNELSVEVTGDVLCETSIQNDGTEAFSNGAEILLYNDSETNINIGGDVTAKSDTDATSVYVNTWTRNDAVTKANIEIEGSVTADADRTAYGITVYDHGNSDIDISVNGDVTANGDRSYAKGLNIYQYGTDSNLDVDVAGDISATSDFYAAGIYVYQEGKGNRTDIDVSGDINAEITGEVVDAIGIKIINKNGETDVNVTGDINATTHYVDDCSSYGIDVDANNANVNINIQGGIINNSPTNSWGMLINAENSEINTTVQNGIEITSDCGTALALNSIRENSEINVEITEGGIISKPNDDKIKSGPQAIWLDNQGGTINVFVNGDVESHTAIRIYSESNVIRDPIEDDKPIVINEDEFYENVPEYGDDDAIVGYEKVYYNKEEDYYYNDRNEKWRIVDTTSGGSNTIIVDGDVHGEVNGLEFLNDDGIIMSDVLVTGTLSGKNSPVYGWTNMDNLTLTVWEIEPNKDGALAKRFDRDERTHEDKSYQDTSFEKTIQYIIKITEESQKTITGLAGISDYKGYDVAKEGETVTLKMTIPQGYRLAGVYGDVGQLKNLLQDAQGNYYLVVPRGGGVMLSAKLEKLPEEKPDEAKPEEEPEVKVEVVNTPMVINPSMKKVADTTATTAIKNAIQAAANADIHSFLPADIQGMIPAEFNKLAELLTLQLNNYKEELGSVTFYLKTEKKYTEGDEAWAIFIVPNGESNLYFAVKGIGQKNGTLKVTLDAETLKALANKVFIVMITKE